MKGHDEGDDEDDDMEEEEKDASPRDNPMEE